MNVIASLQLTIWAERETQGRTAETFVTVSDRFSPGEKAGPVGRPSWSAQPVSPPGQPSRDAVALAHRVVQTRPSRSTT